MASERAVLIIGIDGGTWTVLRPAIETGVMPHLAGLVEEGASGVCESTVPAITPAAWSSFQVGAGPGRTGIVDFFGWDRKLQKLLPADTRRLPPTVWETAGESGARVGVMNLPMSWPPRPVNGYLVSGLMTPSLESDFTWPPHLAGELLAAHPDYHLFHLETAVEEASRESLEAFLDWIGGVVEGRGRAARWLLGREPLDLFMVHFQAVDVLQHVLWAYLDPEHPRFDPVRNRLIQDRFFTLLDREIALIGQAFAESAPATPLTLLISDHGFQTHLGRFSLWRWLRERGHLQVDLSGQAGEGPGNDGPTLDPARSTAIPGGRSNEAFIWLTEEGAARERTGNALRQGLEEVRDPGTGTRVVERVWWREDLYRGDRLDDLPDLVVVPAGGWSITGRWEREEELFRPIVSGEDFHIGRHHPDGIVVVSGAGVRPEKGVRARLIDIAPTVLAGLGIAPLPGMDGTVLPFLPGEDRPTLQSDRAGGHPDRAETDYSPGEAYTPEEQAMVEKRLRDLGYL